jgi:hypothetical protein
MYFRKYRVNISELVFIFPGEGEFPADILRSLLRASFDLAPSLPALCAAGYDPDQKMSDEEADQLILVEKRGLGYDTVSATVHAHGGRLLETRADIVGGIIILHASTFETLRKDLAEVLALTLIYARGKK